MIQVEPIGHYVSPIHLREILEAMRLNAIELEARIGKLERIERRRKA